MKRFFAIIMVVAIFAAAEVFAASMGDMMPVLKQAKKSVNSTLSEIDTDMEKAALSLSGVADLRGDEARKILNGLRKFRPYVIDCSIVDAEGIKITVEPEQYRKYEGEDRSALPSVIELLKDKKPVLSDVYHTAEDVHAVSVGHPILSAGGELRGAVRMLIKHETFLKPLVDNKPFKIWVMQPDGLIVYDPDPDEIGMNIFTDSMFKPFPDLVSFAKTVALRPNGAGSYNFYDDAASDKTVVQKVAVWDTVGLYATEWRIVVMEVENPAGEIAEKPAAEKQVKKQ